MFDHPDVIAALEAGRGWTDEGFTFLQRDGLEQFVSWDRLRVEAMNRAAHVRALGLDEGDRLALVMPDGQDFVPTFLGAVWAGVVPVPLPSPPLSGSLDAYAKALDAILTVAAPSALATTSRLETVMRTAAARLPSVEDVITTDRLRDEAPLAAAREPARANADDVAFLQFTSGSTSTPKGVEVTHGSLRANAWAIVRDGLALQSRTDYGVSWLPLHHDMGLIGFVLSPVFHKIPTALISPASFTRNPTIWLDTIHRKRGTVSFAPNFAYALTARRATSEQLSKWDLSCVRVLGCGAEPINPQTMRAFAGKFAACGLRPHALLPCYGLAEATLAVSFGDPDRSLATDIIDRDAYETRQRADPAAATKLPSHEAVEFVSCGHAFPGHDVAAFDPDGRRLPDRQVGELWVSGPSLARAYYRNPDASQKVFVGGWLRTGDLGYLVNGDIYVTGRRKDVIIINGHNYDPQHIEWAAADVPEVRAGSTVAFSVPGAATEQLVVVLESRTARPTVVTEMVKRSINERLQLVASEVVVMPPGSLPKTPNGKFQRSKTRQQYLEGAVSTRST